MPAPKTAPLDQAQQTTMARTLVNRIAETRELPPPWPETDTELPSWMAGADVSEWGVAELGAFRERLLSAEDRASGGSWYTPPHVADFMTRFSIGPIIDRLAKIDDPGNALQVLAIDPSCGAGVFLVSAARLIARRYAALIAGAEPTEWMVRHVMPEVMSECVFGVDIDPVAVDLARSALWLETGGTEPVTFMDRNVICGNVLAQDLPPKFEERYGKPAGVFAGEGIAVDDVLFDEEVGR